MNSKSVLFVCKANWFRSQIAAAVFNKLTNSSRAQSAGTLVGSSEPEGVAIKNIFPDSYLFELMNAHGMDISDNTTHRLTPELLDTSDVVISMAEDTYTPDMLAQHPGLIRWDVPDVKLGDRPGIDATYVHIEMLVKDLIKREDEI